MKFNLANMHVHLIYTKKNYEKSCRKKSLCFLIGGASNQRWRSEALSQRPSTCYHSVLSWSESWGKTDFEASLIMDRGQSLEDQPKPRYRHGKKNSIRETRACRSLYFKVLMGKEMSPRMADFFLEIQKTESRGFSVFWIARQKSSSE